MKTTLFRSFVIGVCLMICGSAQALPVPITGSIDATSGGGMTATGAWGEIAPEAKLSWAVTALTTKPGFWMYEYTFQVPEKELSHFILETSSTFTVANLSSVTGGWELGTWGTEGNSNPGMPEELYGLKFPGSNLLDGFLVVTDRAPMWGSFYAKDGRDGTDDVFAYNASFGEHSSASISGPAPYGLILVPDTKSTAIPEPGSALLLGIGFLAMAGMRKRRIS